MTAYSTHSSYLKDSGFSSSKKKTLVIWMIIMWIAAALILGFPSLLMVAFMSAYPPTFWEAAEFLIGPAIVAVILICGALSIQAHIKTAALKNRRRWSQDESSVLEGQDYLPLSPWTSKKGIELHPVFKKGHGSNFIFMLPHKPTEELKESTVAIGPDMAGCIQWDPQSGVIQRVSVSEHHQGIDWRRQGIATFLYRKARNVTPHLKHGDDLTDDARAWIKTLAEETS